MKKGLLFILITALLALTCIFTACGEDKKDTKSDTESTNASEVASVSDETTVVLETTSEGGTVEQDSEGNKITKDKDGKVTAVEDKNGNPIVVMEYLTTHSWVDNTAANGNSGSGQSDKSSGASSGKSSSGSASGKSSSGSSNNTPSEKSNSSSEEEDAEDDIPVIIATLPEDSDDMVDLSDIL